MREIATKRKPVFVQANSNSGQGHVLHYITSFCVVFRLSTLYFWLAGKTETKQVVNRMSKWVEGGGSWKGHESGQAVFTRLFQLAENGKCWRIFQELFSLGTHLSSFSRALRANFATTPLLHPARQNCHATQASTREACLTVIVENKWREQQSFSQHNVCFVPLLNKISSYNNT